MYGNKTVKMLEIKLGFWDNVRKYNGKKFLEIKLGFGDMNACCKPRLKFNTLELVLSIAPMWLISLNVFGAWRNACGKMIGGIGCDEGCWFSTSSSWISSLRLLRFLLLSSSSWYQNTKRYPFSGHFYTSLEAPRLSNFLDVYLQLKMIIQSRMEDFSIQWVRLA